jgi:hypothetical protein
MRFHRSFVFLLTVTVAIGFAQWGPDHKLSTTDSSAQLNENMGPNLVTSGDTVHVLWCDNQNRGNAVYYKRSVDGGTTWGADTRLSAVPGHSDFPSIAISGSTLHVVFRDNRSGSNVSYYKRSLDGGNTWGPDVFLDAAYWWPSVAAEGSKVYVALNDTIIRNDTSNSEVYFMRSVDNGANWGQITQISNAAGRSEDPAIAACSGYVHMAWNDTRTGIMQTWYRRSADSGVTWGPETQVSNSTGSIPFAYSPMIGLYGHDVYIPWEDRRSGDFDIYLRHSSNFGTSWNAEERITQDPAASAYPYIVRDGQNIHLVWFGIPGGLYYTYSGNAGASWVPALCLVDASNQPMHPFIAVTGQKVHLIWSDMRDGHRAIYYKNNPTGNPAPASVVSKNKGQGSGIAALPGNGKTGYSVFDISGRMMRRIPGDRIAADLPAGVYLIRPEGLSIKPVRVMK